MNKILRSGKASMIEEFIQSVYCCVQSRGYGGTQPPVASTLEKLCQDLLWLVGFYGLVQFTEQDASEFSDGEFVLSTTADLNAYGMIRTILKQASILGTSKGVFSFFLLYLLTRFLIFCLKDCLWLPNQE
jgi:hypothetical protein